MDAVMPSVTGRTGIISSSFVNDSLWSVESAAQRFWDEWTPSLPYSNTYMEGGTVTTENVDSTLPTSADTVPRPSTIEGEVAYYQEAVGSAGTEEGLSLTFDMTDATSLNMTTYFYWIDYADTDSTMYVKVDGTKVFELDSRTGNQHEWTDRTFDVSSYSGEVEVELGITSFNNQFHVGLFTKLGVTE